jgi:DNA/RNA non-specific endonuclease
LPNVYLKIRLITAPFVVKEHLLAKSLGGSGGITNNLVPMTTSANTCTYNVVESFVAKLVLTKGSVEYSVEPVYDPITSKIPKEIKYVIYELVGVEPLPPPATGNQARFSSYNLTIKNEDPASAYGIAPDGRIIPVSCSPK